MLQPSLFRKKPGEPATVERVIFEGETVTATSPEGTTASMPITGLIERLAPQRMDTLGVVLPDGVKCVLPIPGGTVLVKEVKPRVHPMRWIAADSPVPYGPSASYREVTIALPYTIVVAVFENQEGGMTRLGRSSECFFSNQSLDREGLDTQLSYPALLNCSRFPALPAHPLSWICVEHLPHQDLRGAESATDGYRLGLAALLEHLFGAAFNLSSDANELASWFSETVRAGVDERLSSVEAWEQATREDPLFALEVPWLPTGHTLREVAQRIVDARGAGSRPCRTTRDLGRIVFQNETSDPGRLQSEPEGGAE